MIVTELDDDDDMENPYNVDYGYDDTYDDLDEEDDEFYWRMRYAVISLLYIF